MENWSGSFSGEFGKVFGDTCPNDDCEHGSLRMVRGTEQMEAVAFCGSCGSLFEQTVSEFDQELDSIVEQDGDAVVETAQTADHDVVTVEEIVRRYRDNWTRYEIASELEVSVKAVREAVVWYLQQASDEYDGDSFAYHFLGTGVEEEAAEDLHTVNPEPEVADRTVRASLSLLKHENKLQMDVRLVGEDEEYSDGEQLVSIGPTIPAGYYHAVREELVDAARAFADYYGDDPDT